MAVKLPLRSSCIRASAHSIRAKRRPMSTALSRPKNQIRILLLEGISDTAVDVLQGRRLHATSTAGRRRSTAPSCAQALRGRAHARHPLAHPAHRRRHRRRPIADRDRLLLGRHQPGRSRRRRTHGHSGLQRAVLQHAQRRRADDRRDRHAAAAHLPEVASRRTRAAGTSARPAPTRCAARRSASSATATSAASSRRSPRRWACA